MKLKNILTYCIVLYLVTACSSAGDQKTVENTAAEGEPVKMATILNDDGCFEKKMEQWFTKFNQLQNEGHTMEEAHQGAIASVALEFENCNTDPIAVSEQENK